MQRALAGNAESASGGVIGAPRHAGPRPTDQPPTDQPPGDHPRGDHPRGDQGAAEGGDAGFTLIELMVALLIMAILLAIALPTFLGVKTGAQDRSAQSDLTNAITAVKAVVLLQGQFPTNMTGAGNAYAVIDEPELTFTWVPVTYTESHWVSGAVSSDGRIVILSDQSADGRCWYAEDNEEPQPNVTDGMTGAGGRQGITYNESPAPEASCNAFGPVLMSAVWSQSYPPA
jgi:type IV pilus assembly protein PilA